MKRWKKPAAALLVMLALVLALWGCTPAADIPTVQTMPDKAGAYTQAADVAAYLHAYGRLPDNFITKQQARERGWEGGSLEAVAPGLCIGGDRFYNREGLLPEAEGRLYFECDIGTLGRDSRGPERIVYSSDGLIYYTGDHYASFTLLYGNAP